MSDKREPVEFEVRERPVVLAFDAERTAYSNEQDDTADRTGVVLSEEKQASAAQRAEYWSVTWNGELAGHVHRRGSAKWWYSEHGGNGKGGYDTAEEAARDLASRYGYFRHTGNIYRRVGGWQDWHQHRVRMWFVVGDSGKRVRVTTPEELEAEKKKSVVMVPHVEEFEVSVACEKDKPHGLECKHCEEGKHLNGYVAFVEGKRHEVYAETLAKASEQARALYKGRKRHPSVNVMLAEKDEEPVVHTAAD